MQLTINAGGISGAFGIMDLQMDLRAMIDNTSDVIGSFKTIMSDTYSLSGGVGVLQSAVDNIACRIAEENRKVSEQEEFVQTVDEFLELAISVDSEVAAAMAANEEKFYELHPGLRPVVEVEEEQGWLDHVWEWLCSVGEEVGEFLSDPGGWITGKIEEAVTDLKALWNMAVDFYEKHKEVINKVLATVAIAACAILTIAAIVACPAALVPLLGLIGITGSVAVTVSTVIAAVAVATTAIASVLNVVDVWGEFDNPYFNSFQTVFNVTSAITALPFDIMDMANTFKMFKTAVSRKFGGKAAKELAEHSADDVARALSDTPPDGLMKTAADGLDNGVDDAVKALPEGETYDPRMDDYDSLTEYYEALDAGGPKNTTDTIDHKPEDYKYPTSERKLTKIKDSLLEVDRYPDGRYVPGKKGVVTQGDSKLLGKNLNEQLGLNRTASTPGYQNAHIIPSELGDHRVIQEIGMDMNHASNGIKLPDTAGHTLSQHKGDHTIYTEFVESRLDELGKRADALNLTPDQRYEFLQKGVKEIQIDSRKLLQQGLPGYKPKDLTEVVNPKKINDILNDDSGALLDELTEDRMKQDRTSFESWGRNYSRISNDADFSKLAQEILSNAM